MGIRQIRVNDDPILRKVSRPVENFDAKLFKLLDAMRDTLYDRRRSYRAYKSGNSRERRSSVRDGGLPLASREKRHYGSSENREGKSAKQRW